MKATFQTAGPVLLFVAMLAYLGPRLDEANATYEAGQQAQQQAQREAHYLKAIQTMCGGEEAVAVLMDDGSFQCRDKHGRKTRRVSL